MRCHISQFNEYSQIKRMAIRPAISAYQSQSKIDAEWQDLRFHEVADYAESLNEYAAFRQNFIDAGVELIELPKDDDLTLDSIYVRDAAIISPKGLILCNMGRASRNNEPTIHGEVMARHGIPTHGRITAPGSVEGGDFIWVNEKAAAIGEGPRTNAEGIRQLGKLLGPDVDLHVVALPDPNPEESHPDDVFHLMSMISPLDEDLSLIYRPLMPASFISWLERHGMKFAEVPDDEFSPMGCNVLAISPREVLMLENLPGTKANLEAAGCTVHTYKGLEISRKGEGGPTCLTRPLVRG